jgi:DNA-binding NarL/FixJ family response regulator
MTGTKFMTQDDLIKILIVARNSIFRIGLKMLIETKKNLKVVGEAADIAEASNIISRENPNVILLDFPENGSSNLFTLLMGEKYSQPILVLADSHDDKTSQKCLRLGTKGLVLKENSAEVLFKAIEKVNKGEFWFDRAVMGQTIKNLVAEKENLSDNLHINKFDLFTEREKQVIDLICKGLKNRAIADKLFITETTVRHHLTSIFEKLGISSRLELVVYAFQHQLVKIPPISGGALSQSGNSPVSYL